MRDVYTKIKTLSDKLIVARSTHGDQLLSLGKVRRGTHCAMTGRRIDVGELAWRTVNASTMNRNHRIAREAFDG